MANLKEIKKSNPNLVDYPVRGFGKAVTYDSLFEDDYVVQVWAGEDAQQLLNAAYASRQWWFRQVEAIAKSRDGLFWFISADPSRTMTEAARGAKYLPPLAWHDGSPSNKLKAIA